MSDKRGALALVAGGALWALVMVAYILTHGPSTFDHKRLLFGFSRDNYLLLLSPVALLLGYGLIDLRKRFLPLTGRLFAAASVGVLILLGLFAAGNLGLTSLVGVGEHTPWPDDRLISNISGAVQSLSLLPLGLGLALMGFALLRARRFRRGATVLLVPLALIALTPWQPIHGYLGVAFGVSWAILGALYAAFNVREA